ncbi:hypothetical protein E2562_000088 [Oryza meyeriana var. granulata]|uniref:Uncharacterized protein n=1 Tax=Oryza meyeriana var. granulata TaxID=110450 RepID=A0A6G1DBT5_9ORYZ|nr:hypothetical protein E2562_000088 [Oryza meyeriana var. granulata]
MSKPVYPLVFRNPVSEAEASGMPESSNAERTTPSDDSPVWRRSLASPELKFHNALNCLEESAPKSQDNEPPCPLCARETHGVRSVHVVLVALAFSMTEAMMQKLPPGPFPTGNLEAIVLNTYY